MNNVSIRITLTSLFAALIMCTAPLVLAEKKKDAPNTQVTMETTLGSFVIELFPKQAPISVANFLQYVDDHFYNGTTFHRVAPGFVLQGGGYTYDFVKKETRDPIINESDNDYKNEIWTLSMARTSDPDSGTSQFFVNLNENKNLDKNSSSAGYAVFGKVISGFDVLKKIEKEPRGIYRGYPEAPNYPVIIEKAYRSTPSADAESTKD